MKAGNPRLAIPILAVVVFAAILGLFGYRRAQQQTPDRMPEAVRPGTIAAMPGASAPTSTAGAAAGGSGGPTAPLSTPARSAPARPDAVAPSFDIVRVEPTGESVIAGRAAPGATIDLMRNGESFARVMADPSGLFAIVPPPLPVGPHELVLQAIAPDGVRAQSGQSVTVVIAENGATRPLVAVTAPDQPTVVLSRPDGEPSEGRVASVPKIASPALPAGASAPSKGTAPNQASPETPRAGLGGKLQPGASEALSTSPVSPAAKRAEVRIAALEAEGSGRLFVSGLAAPGATLRLYLNDAFVAPGGTDAEGRLSFSIEKGVQPGDYRVRLDDVDPVSGTVKSRAEVRFNVPVQIAAATPPGAATAPPVTTGSRSADGLARRPDAMPALERAILPGGLPSGAASGQVGAIVPARQTDPGQVLVPEINTAIVARGDNLWRISKRIYGQGTRYTVIFGANQPQIRDAKMIFPGQVFVLPPGTDSVVR